MFKFRTTAVVLSLAISGCASFPNDFPLGDTGVDGAACIGQVATPVRGLVESSNAALLAQALFQSGKGGVCSAKVFSVTAPVVLYRVFDAGKPHSKFGRWWSLKRPAGPRDDYRAANAICREWSNLDRLISCEVMPGTQVVIGTTQSAECGDGTRYAGTAENQVFVANDGSAGILHVGACIEEAGWP